MPDKLPELFLKGISEISVDASSIIYMLKTGILGYAAAEITLIAAKEIIEEVGWPRLPVTEIPLESDDLTNDETVLTIAEANDIPLLSEDLEILNSADEKGIPFFNTLMILNYLFHRKRITREEYPVYLERLTQISHYSDDVLKYGEAIRALVEESESD